MHGKGSLNKKSLPKAFRNNFIHILEFCQLVESNFTLLSKHIHYLLIYFLLYFLDYILCRIIKWGINL